MPSLSCELARSTVFQLHQHRNSHQCFRHKLYAAPYRHNLEFTFSSSDLRGHCNSAPCQGLSLILLVYPYGHQLANMHPYSSIPFLLTLCLSFFRVVHASVTVYGIEGALTTAITTASSATYTGPQAYNPILLQAPPLPNPAPANTFNIQLANAVPVGSSIKLPGSFMGFSIEFSVLNQVCMCGLLFKKLTLILSGILDSGQQ